MIRWIVGLVAFFMVFVNAYTYVVSPAPLWAREFFVSMVNAAIWVAVMWVSIDEIIRDRARYRLPKNRNVKLRK